VTVGTESSSRVVEAGSLPGQAQPFPLPERLHQRTAALVVLGLSVLIWALIGAAIGWVWG